MRRRQAISIILALALVAATPLTAVAWRNNGDGYSTHDWILDHAIERAGSPAWVDRDIALHATDDPDVLELRKYLHYYVSSGRYRGAPQQVADLYAQIVAAHGAGDDAYASLLLGRLSHYLADVTNPLHSSFVRVPYSGFHNDYEGTVESLTTTFGAGAEMLSTATVQPVPDVRRATIQTALFSRGYVRSLVSTSAADPAGPAFQFITHAVLSRAVNDLASLIVSVDAGQGLATSVSGMNVRLTKRFIANGTRSYVVATATDAKGNPLEAVGINLLWNLQSGPASATAYTNASGNLYWYQAIGTNSLMVTRTVDWSTSTNGETTSGAQWFMPSPRLATGTHGFAASASPSRPLRGSHVHLRSVAISTSGKPVPRLPITFTCKFKTKTVRLIAYTDSKGVASAVLRLARTTTRGYRVSVTARTTSGGVDRSASSSFTPR